MIALISPSKDVFFNLAAEEYFLKSCKEDVAFFYLNDPCVVVGKHQNALAETNYPFLQENKIPLARRLSGGGTVFHDKGNINFSFIRNFTENATSVNFKGFLDPVLAFLQSQNIPAEYSDRNDLLVEGKKFSGNAEHVHQQGKRTLHHGTILFDSELDKLGKAITNIGNTYTHKAVASVRSKVANVSPYLKEMVQISEFTEKMLAYYIEKDNTQKHTFSIHELDVINTLKREKFSTWEWNVGYSPKYSMTTEVEYEGSLFTLSLRVEKGIIVEFSMPTHPLSNKLTPLLLHHKLEWNLLQQTLELNGFETEFVSNLTQKLF